MIRKIHIVDYGLGNLHSVHKACEYLGMEVVIALTGEELRSAEKIILPGVGAFADGMRGLEERGHAEALKQHSLEGGAILGICLGAQLLLDESEEFGRTRGLGIIPGTVKRIPDSSPKIPHVGWAQLYAGPKATWKNSVLNHQPEGLWTYFVHSYHPCPEETGDLLAVSRYGEVTIHAAVSHGAVVGCQFHPEKSGSDGLTLLENYFKL